MSPHAPVRMTVHWIWKYTYIFALEALLLLAWQELTSRQIGLAALFATLSLGVVLAMIHSRSFAEVDRDAVVVYTAPFGKYMIRWDEISQVETDGVGYVFHGADKALSLSTLLGSNVEPICDKIERQIKLRGIAVRRVHLAPMLLARNTKVA